MPFLTQGKTNWKFIAIVAVLAIIVGGGIWFLSGPEQEKPIMFEQELTGDIEEKTAGWQTYRNGEIGIEFDYPSFLRTPKPVIADYSQAEYPEIFLGKKATLFLNEPTESIQMSFAAYTADYKAFKEGPFTGGEDMSLFCLKPLSYSDKGDVCKKVIFPWGEAIFENIFWEDEGDVGLYTKLYFNNITDSTYRGLEFTIALSDVNDKIRSVFAGDNWQGERVYLEARTQSENIINQENLSEKDKNALNIFNQIISSVVFIEEIKEIGPDDIGKCITPEGCEEFGEYLAEFREMGIVDLGTMSFPQRANTNSAYYLLNGYPAVISTEIYQDSEAALMVEIEKESLYLEMNNQYSSIWLWGFAPQFIDKIYFPDSKRFLFRYRFVDGCRVCHTEYFADVGFDFDSNGKFIEITFIEIVKD